MLSVRVFWRVVCAGLLVGAPGLTAARRSATAPAPDRIDRSRRGTGGSGTRSRRQPERGGGDRGADDLG